MVDAVTGNELVLVDDPDVVGEWFQRWREALLEVAIYDREIWKLQAERIVFSNYGFGIPGVLGSTVALGVDPVGANWAVQINEPKIAGSENPTSGICHELVHAFHPGHGPEWRGLLDTVMPDWESRKARLEDALR